MWPLIIVIASSLTLGFLCGYGVRAVISRRRRAQAQRLGITRGSSADARGPTRAWPLKDTRRGSLDDVPPLQPVTGSSFNLQQR